VVSTFRIILAVIITAALLAAGAYLDVFVLLIGGIEEIVRGVQSHGSLETHDIAFGIVRVICCGAGVFVAGILILAVWFSWPES
jgi:hypothetical protein